MSITEQILSYPHSDKMGKNKILNITHYDLDGVGCAIVLNEIYNCTSIPTGYNDLTEHISSLNQFITSDITDIYITDLQVTQEQLILIYKYCKQYPNIKWTIIDHHDNMIDYIDQINIKLQTNNINNQIKYIYSKKLCGTGLTCKLFAHVLPPHIIELCRIINIYDLWKMEHSDFNNSIILNNLFWEYKFWKFLNTFSDINTSVNSPHIVRDIKRILENKSKYIDQIRKSNCILLTDTWCISFADLYINEFSILIPNKYYYINITSKGNISLRIHPLLDIPNIIEDFKQYAIQFEPTNYGGHEFIFSISYNKTIDELIDIVHSYVLKYK